jgi:hypothetical protein
MIGCAPRHRLDHDQAERLWPVDRKEQSRGSHEKFLLDFIVDFTGEDFTGELDLIAVDLRLQFLVEETPLATRHLSRQAAPSPQFEAAFPPHRQCESG